MVEQSFCRVQVYRMHQCMKISEKQGILRLKCSVAVQYTKSSLSFDFS